MFVYVGRSRDYVTVVDTGFKEYLPKKYITIYGCHYIPEIIEAYLKHSINPAGALACYIYNNWDLKSARKNVDEVLNHIRSEAKEVGYEEYEKYHGCILNKIKLLKWLQK